MVFRQLKKNPQPALIIIGVYIILAVIDVVVAGGNQVTHTSTSISSESSANFSFLGIFIFLLALPIYTLALADRKKISLGEFFKIDVGAYFSILGASIAASVLLVLASIPLLIPLIWVVPWMAFIAYAVIDKKAGPSKAISESKATGKDNKGKVWGIIGASIVLNIASIVLFFIPVLGVVASGIVSPLVSILTYGAIATLYRWIQQNQGQPAPAVSGAPAPPQPPVAPTPPVAPAPPQPPVAPAPPVA
jgi:hypothetical protein